MKRPIGALLAAGSVLVAAAFIGPTASIADTPVCTARAIAPTHVTLDRAVVPVPVRVQTNCVDFNIEVAFNFNGTNSSVVVFSDSTRSATATAGGQPTPRNQAYPKTAVTSLYAAEVNGSPVQVGFSPTTVTLKFAAYAYIASSRAGKIVSINGLFKQYTIFGLQRMNTTKLYLQRYLNGAWQTMLVRPPTPDGQLAARFVQPRALQYRVVALEQSNTWGTYSATAAR